MDYYRSIQTKKDTKFGYPNKYEKGRDIIQKGDPIMRKTTTKKNKTVILKFAAFEFNSIRSIAEQKNQTPAEFIRELVIHKIGRDRPEK